ncbi:hypothetical protein TMEN_8302 [Trichophyton mentagrophytes]|nr:hypothetical protein H101_00662 [Trichophyton interdigitale H6]GBF65585.1 hypothetical protein TMEN_8302 [Trichophyton mentagrophytes]
MTEPESEPTLVVSMFWSYWLGCVHAADISDIRFFGAAAMETGQIFEHLGIIPTDTDDSVPKIPGQYLNVIETCCPKSSTSMPAQYLSTGINRSIQNAYKGGFFNGSSLNEEKFLSYLKKCDEFVNILAVSILTTCGILSKSMTDIAGSASIISVVESSFTAIYAVIA